MASTTFFEDRIVAAYPQPPELPMAIEGLKGTLFFVNFQGRTDLNYQINYAFGGDTYAYTFGDKLSMSSISGIAHNTDCGDNSTSSPEEFIKFYKQYKLGEAASPLRITVGGMVIAGYFVSLSINLIGAEGAATNAYTFQFNFLGRVSQ